MLIINVDIFLVSSLWMSEQCHYSSLLTLVMLLNIPMYFMGKIFPYSFFQSSVKSFNNTTLSSCKVVDFHLFHVFLKGCIIKFSAQSDCNLRGTLLCLNISSKTVITLPAVFVLVKMPMHILMIYQYMLKYIYFHQLILPSDSCHTDQLAIGHQLPEQLFYFF